MLAMRLLAPLIIAMLLPGCSLIYRIDVQQGNYVTQDLLDRLKPGMTKAEVKQVLGTPLLNDVFHANRWDYYFSNVKGGKAEDRSRLSVFFENDKLARFAGGGRPGTTSAAQLRLPNPATTQSTETPEAPTKASPAANPAPNPVRPGPVGQ
jgi:outer membrane protein assembly factor BamE